MLSRMLSGRGSIQPDHERLPRALTYFLRELIRRTHADFASHQYPPEIRVALPQDDARRAEFALQRFAPALRSIAVLKRADLHRIQFRFGGRRRRDDFDAHRRDTRADKIDLPRSRVRKIDDASVDEWTAVDNPDIDKFLVQRIRHTHPGVERQRAMRRDERLHVIDLAVRRGRPWYGCPYQLARPVCAACGIAATGALTRLFRFAQPVDARIIAIEHARTARFSIRVTSP